MFKFHRHCSWHVCFWLSLRALFRFAFLPWRRAVRFKRLLIPKSPKLSKTVEFAWIYLSANWRPSSSPNPTSRWSMLPMSGCWGGQIVSIAILSLSLSPPSRFVPGSSQWWLCHSGIGGRGAAKARCTPRGTCTCMASGRTSRLSRQRDG